MESICCRVLKVFCVKGWVRYRSTVNPHYHRPIPFAKNVVAESAEKAKEKVLADYEKESRIYSRATEEIGKGKRKNPNHLVCDPPPEPYNETWWTVDEIDVPGYWVVPFPVMTFSQKMD